MSTLMISTYSTTGCGYVKINNVKGLDYALLAALCDEPRSGLELAQWFTKSTAHFWAAHHSSIYPALARLELAGMVRHHLEPSERGPQRKVYEVTSAGRSELLAWTVRPPTAPEIRDEQLVKVLAFDLLPRDEAVGHFVEARKRHVAQRDHYRALLVLASNDKSHLGRRLTVLRGALMQDASIAWCDQAIELLEGVST